MLLLRRVPDPWQAIQASSRDGNPTASGGGPPPVPSAALGRGSTVAGPLGLTTGLKTITDFGAADKGVEDTFYGQC